MLKRLVDPNGTGARYPRKNFFLSVLIAGILVLLSLIEGDPAVTNGLWVGSATGIVFFCIAWWCVSVIVKNKKNEKVNPFLAIVALHVFVLKFPLLGIALWYAFKYMPINPFALVGGIAVTQIAILISGLQKLMRKQ
ncbi:MAG: ATP synthase subunit I [Desulfobacterota bacterium]|nr:ATP synthase subunit I [Thermodesulfobacteriota bacterium]